MPTLLIKIVNIEIYEFLHPQRIFLLRIFGYGKKVLLSRITKCFAADN
jgi:hypothetical protein